MPEVVKNLQDRIKQLEAELARARQLHDATCWVLRPELAHIIKEQSCHYCGKPLYSPQGGESS